MRQKTELEITLRAGARGEARVGHSLDGASRRSRWPGSEARVAGTDASYARQEPRADRQGAVGLPHWVARLLRLLRDSVDVARPRPVDPATAACHRLEAVETRDYSVRRAATPRRRPGSGGANRW